MDILEDDGFEREKTKLEYGIHRREYIKENLYNDRNIENEINNFCKELNDQEDIKIGTYLEDGKIIKNDWIDKPITSASPIIPNPMTKGFFLNDDEIYKLPIENIKKLEESKQWDTTSLNTKMIVGIEMSVVEYFGRHGNEESRRELFENSKDIIDIKEMKHKDIGVCQERTALAHNLASFLGIRSIMVNGKLKYEQDEKEKEISHAFNIFDFDGDKYLLDFTNEENMFPAIQKLSDKDLANFKEGKHVLVDKVRNVKNAEYWKE